MANQITGDEGRSGEPFTFVIPIHFTDSDGTYYENMRLVVTHDATLGDHDRSSVGQSIEDSIQKARTADAQYDQFGFPEQDAWEGSVYELGGRPMRCDVKCLLYSPSSTPLITFEMADVINARKRMSTSTSPDAFTAPVILVPIS